MNEDQRNIEAVKRSVHFVLPDNFKRSLEQLVPVLTRQFWSYLDEKTNTRQRLRDSAWTVWLRGGVNTMSVSFTHSTQLIIDKVSHSLSLSLKETGGKSTELTRVNVTEMFGDDPMNDINVKAFNSSWNNLAGRQSSYPNSKRPVVSSVAEVISNKYSVPLPVVLLGLVTSFVPSQLSNGLIELYKKMMPGEVFHERTVNEALQAGEVERVDQWRFQVVKRRYQEWRARVTVNQFNKIQTAPAQQTTVETNAGDENNAEPSTAQQEPSNIQ